MRSVEQSLARDLSRRDKKGAELGRAVLGWSGEVTGVREQEPDKLLVGKFTRKKASMKRGGMVKGAMLTAVKLAGGGRGEGRGK